MEPCKKYYLLPKNGKFYKGNLHMHTVVSDGKMTPEEVKEEYKKRGYSFLAYTDHEIIVKHNDLTDDEFLAITSAEFSVTAAGKHGWPTARTYHLNVYSPDPEQDLISVFAARYCFSKNTLPYVTDEMRNIPDYQRVYSVEGINDFVARCNAEGFLVSYNHPVWSLQDANDWYGLKGLWGVEWQNTGCYRAGYPDTMQPIDDLLRQNERVMPLATDDAHSRKDSLHDCFGGWVTVKAEKLDYATIFAALKNGDFYSSQGPELTELTLKDGVLTVKCSEARKVYITTERRYMRSVEWKNDTPITEAQFNLAQYIADSKPMMEAGDWNPYFRVTVVGTDGFEAQSRAYFLDELK